MHDRMSVPGRPGGITHRPQSSSFLGLRTLSNSKYEPQKGTTLGPMGSHNFPEVNDVVDDCFRGKGFYTGWCSGRENARGLVV